MKRNIKTIGLIGGMSWESTMPYYKLINQAVQAELGGIASARIILYSFEFSELESYQRHGEWAKCQEMLLDAAEKLQAAGAECLAICANTMHKFIPALTEKIDIPIVHIADATAETVHEQGIGKVALLGTKYTLTEDFYVDRLRENGLSVIVPESEDITYINDVIFQELCCGILSDESRKGFNQIINKLAQRGAEGVILGCTEIGLLISQQDVDLPVFDTTVIHAEKIAKFALES